jgi:hypothetical protein
MVTITNAERDMAVKYLQAFSALMGDDDRTQVMNLCRLSRRLAKQLKKRPKHERLDKDTP